MAELKLTKKQENKISMFKDLETVLDNNVSIIDRIPQLKDSTDKFKNLITDISNKAVIKNTVLKGSVITKTNKRIELETAILESASALSAFGSKTENEIIKAISHTTSSSLDKSRDTDLINKANSILDMMVQNETALVSYAVSSDDIEKLRNCIAAYKNSSAVTSGSKTESLLINKSLQELFQEGMHILEFEIDKMVDSLKSKEKNFYDSYYAVRTIKNLGIRHRKLPEVNSPGIN